MFLSTLSLERVSQTKDWFSNETRYTITHGQTISFVSTVHRRSPSTWFNSEAHSKLAFPHLKRETNYLQSALSCLSLSSSCRIGKRMKILSWQTEKGLCTISLTHKYWDGENSCNAETELRRPSVRDDKWKWWIQCHLIESLLIRDSQNQLDNTQHLYIALKIK